MSTVDHIHKYPIRRQTSMEDLAVPIALREIASISNAEDEVIEWTKNQKILLEIRGNYIEK